VVLRDPLFLDLTERIRAACNNSVEPFLNNAKGSNNLRLLLPLDAIHLTDHKSEFGQKILRLTEDYYDLLTDIVGIMGNVHTVDWPLAISNLDKEYRQHAHTDFPVETELPM